MPCAQFATPTRSRAETPPQTAFQAAFEPSGPFRGGHVVAPLRVRGGRCNRWGVDGAFAVMYQSPSSRAGCLPAYLAR